MKQLFNLFKDEIWTAFIEVHHNWADNVLRYLFLFNSFTFRYPVREASSGR